MKGAREYAQLFDTGQHGKLYLVSAHHARGRTFRIFVLPEGEKAKPNGQMNPPTNKDAVEVYGSIAGLPGWTEEYGWIHRGKWVDDFNRLVEQKQKEMADTKKENQKLREEGACQESRKIANLLLKY